MLVFPLAQIRVGVRRVGGSISSASGFPCLSLRFRTRRSCSSSFSTTSAMAATDSATNSSNLRPPVAKKVKHEMEMFGDVRVDNYYWLRDDSRSNPELLSYLQQENAYTDFIMSGTKHLEDQIYAELRGRIKEDDISAPIRKGNYYYYERTLEGKEYVQHCRRLVENGGAVPSVHDIMPTGSEAPPEHVILDENVKAKEHAYYSIGAFQVSPNHKLVAYAEDTKGDEIYTIHVMDAETCRPVGEPLVGVTCYLEWAGDEALLYVTMDAILRPDKDVKLFSDHLVVYEREKGLPRVTYYSLPAVSEPLESLQGGRAVDFIDPVYSVDPAESQFSSSLLRFCYSSLRTPPSTYDYDMNTGVSVLKKIETVLGGFDASNYVTKREWAIAQDGTHVPISIVYRKDLVKLDGSDPLLLYGYGSYEICLDPSFKASRLSLLDRGFIYAISHIRGGGEMGRKWYENGKYLQKKNTFTDFIDCAEYLIEKKYCTKEKLCINGRSAGGLLIGAVLNMRPDLFKVAVAGVPFVDVVTTMLDPTIPLTTAEWEEWGDPRKEEFYFYMKSYSPVDNVKAQNYPAILVTAGLNDPRVLYSEPAKFVAKLREMKTDDNILLFKCEMGAGHFSKSGRFEKLQEDAFTYTFILKILNMVPALA
ncbi:Peptidase S9A/B/C, oligopeptidase, N-terminal beta-propeller [Cynara cardunculus var. scolymus]|uniref:Prolyl endopeptidase n=1 Tax=Cynara cardunculus var. scolymus TaxID=59895 RepID=A0A118JT30_CYNCS|nr:Peptidase S9A/B/C, oligopeptidase, N-terminal beta-propeller [Cynara cardunculus var. scolymus]